MYLDRVKARLEGLNYVRPDEFLPCTEDEVRTIERQLGLPLPEAYREYLLWMGHGAGRLLRGSDCFYEDLPQLRKWAAELLEENSFPKPLPEDAFVFLVHQGYQFNFLRLSEGDDPPVYFYGERTNQISFSVLHMSFSEFLDGVVENIAKHIPDFGN